MPRPLASGQTLARSAGFRFLGGNGPSGRPVVKSSGIGAYGRRIANESDARAPAARAGDAGARATTSGAFAEQEILKKGRHEALKREAVPAEGDDTRG